MPCANATRSGKVRGGGVCFLDSWCQCLVDSWSNAFSLLVLFSIFVLFSGTYYSTEVDIVCANDEPNTQIRGATIELMTYVSSPDDAFKYAPMVLHSLQSQCSVLRTGATAGARALGAVPLQQAAKFTRAFQGGYDMCFLVVMFSCCHVVMFACFLGVVAF